MFSRYATSPRATEGVVATVNVLNDVDLVVKRGQTVGIVGESGCGKSTLARVISGLLPASDGDVLLDGEKLHPEFRKRDRNQLRKVQLVLQMADTALNPRHLIDEILGRPIEFYLGLKGADKRRRIGELLDMVELPAELAGRYPEELSGGQKQRVNLARALAARPEVLLCDEVISALDAIVGASVVELLKRLRKETGVSIVFISHDLSSITQFADEVVVLYAGRVVEQGKTEQVLLPPYHPYTWRLISSVPELRIGWLDEIMEVQGMMEDYYRDRRKRALAARLWNANIHDERANVGRVLNLIESGCPFFHSCPVAMEGTCDRKIPPIRNVGEGHVITCHRNAEVFAE